MSEPDVQRYLDGIESQHQRPRFMSTLRMILEKIDDATMVAKDMPSEFFVQNAVGRQLDVIGDLVGADRRFPPVPVPGYPDILNDDLYRYVVLAKIVQNQWDGTTENFRDIWDNTLGQSINATYHDNQNMSMDVNLTGDFDPLMIELILGNYIIPKPMGVYMNIGVTSETEEKSTWAEAVATASILRTKCGIDYFPDRDTTRTAYAGAACVSNAAKLFAPIACGNEQPAETSVRSGAAGTANCARITITIQS